MSDKNNLLMGSISKYYSKYPENMEKFIEIVMQKSRVSLRIMDWFVTNYAKRKGTKFMIPDKNSSGLQKQFLVFISYKSQLKAFSKKQFDPFCRRDRITFFYTEKDWISTTVGQLNFFRWIFQNNILNYIHENIDDIEHDMASGEHEKKNSTKYVKNENSAKKVTFHRIKIAVQFE